MAAFNRGDPLATLLVGVHTDETGGTEEPDDSCVSTRTDWPQEEFLAWLDAFKERKRLRSDYKLAEYLGIGHTLISGWRNGRQRPSIPTLNQIAQVVEEDPRRLWVLAGAANAVDVGLLERDALPRAGLDLPSEFLDLIEAYRHESLTDADRAAIRRHVHLLAQGILADLASRRPSPGRAKRAG